MPTCPLIDGYDESMIINYKRTFLDCQLATRVSLFDDPSIISQIFSSCACELVVLWISQFSLLLTRAVHLTMGTQQAHTTVAAPVNVHSVSIIVREQEGEGHDSAPQQSCAAPLAFSAHSMSLVHRT